MTRSTMMALAIVLAFAAACTAGTTQSDPPASVSSTLSGRATTTGDPGHTSQPDAVAELDTALGHFLADPSDATLDAAAAASRVARPTAAELTSLLHSAAPFPDAREGRETIAVPIGFNQTRLVRIRTPRGYDPAQAYPTIIAYHTWGGTADRILDRFESLLGDSVEDFVLAAPDNYRQTVLDAPPPVSAEHVAVWDAVKRARHTDGNRFYVMGYSLGGETVMTTVALHGHRVAAGIGMANSFAFPSDVDGLWATFAPNIRDTPILHVWGSDDDLNIPGLNGRKSPAQMAQLNRRFRELADEASLARYRPIELVGVGHENAYPAAELLDEYLHLPRGPIGPRIEHHFRYVHQADTAWVEGHEWEGAAWLEPWPEVTVAPGETEHSAEGRAIAELLGEIDASVADNAIDVTTRHLSDLTVWLTDGLIDFTRPLTVTHNGVEVFTGRVAPDYAVALTQANRTYDFERIRWSGIRIVDGVAHIVTSDDRFPEIARGIRL